VNKSTLDQSAWIELFNQQLGNRIPIGFSEGQEWKNNPRQIIFFNPVNHNSMRLTRAGFKYLKQYLDITYYEFRLKEKITPKILLHLERYIEYPYFILSLSKIIVFDEQTAIMLQLHDGDLETYLNNLEQHR
jgi:hypothetical protein